MPIGAKLYEAASKEEPASDDTKADDAKGDGPVEGEVVDDSKK
jgi:hypothetical protein